MWRILTAYLLVVSLVYAHHDGTDHHHDHDHHNHDHDHDHHHDHKHEEDRKALIMLEIEPNVNNGTAVKGKRSPQHQASYGASPGQFVVRTATGDDSGIQGDVPSEYINLLQQLVAQQHQGAGENAQSQLPVINELLIARNPDQSAVQFSNSPSQPQQPRRPPPSPQAQLQKLYFDRQFQQQIPVRPRLLRPPPQPQPASENQFSTVPATSQVYNIHEARLRASLAGSDPNLAVQALAQQAFSTTLSPEYNQQPSHISASQEQLAELQSVPQSSVSHQQVYSSSPELQYVQQPVERAALYSSSSRQGVPSPQLISVERSKLSRRPAAASAPEQQYLRETTQPLAEQTDAQTPRQQLSSDPKIYLASESGQQTPQSSQDDEFIQQLLSGGGRGLFPSSTPVASDVAEEIIKSTTPLPSRSSPYVTQRSKLKSSPTSSKITIQEVGVPQEDAQTPLPVVHLPTPEGQRPLTQNELQALIDAGFNIQPVSEKSQSTQSITPQYYQQPTTKRQRSYVTPAPPRNQVAYQSRLRKQQEQNEEINYPQQVAVREEEELQQRPQQVNTRHRLQGSKPQQQQEEIVQYVRRPDAQERRARPSQSRFRIVVGNSEPQEQTIQFVQVATVPNDVQQNEQLSTFQPDDVRTQQTTQLLRIQDERESLVPQIQTTRYQPETSEPEQTYQTESVSLPQKSTSYQREEESVALQRSRFHPIVVPELPPTTPLPSSTVSRRRRPRPPTHSRIVFRNQAQEEDPSSVPASAPQQFLLSYDSVPEASSFGTRSRVRARRPEQAEES